MLEFFARSGNLSTNELLIGMGIYAAARPFLSNAIPDGFMGLPNAYSDNIVLGGAGGIAAWKGKGIVKKAGTVVAASEVLVGVSKLMSGIQGGSSESGGEYL